MSKNSNFYFINIYYDKKQINANLDDNRKIYASDENIYNITIIEIKSEKDEVKKENFLELYINIFEDNHDLINKNTYIIQNPKYNFSLQKTAVSYGLIKEIRKSI